MTKNELIFDGNEKRIFATDDPQRVILHFRDVTLAYNGVKRARFVGKGEMNNRISSLLFGYLNRHGIDTHFVEQAGGRDQLCRRIEIVPLEVTVHNRLAGTLAAKLGLPEGFSPANTVVDFCYNSDELGDPLVNAHQAVALSLATYDELAFMERTALRVNALLRDIFHKAGIELVDVKLEFGRAADTGALILSDEISPDTCRLWDEATGEKLDKDRFRLDLSDVVASYRSVLERLEKVMESSEA